LGWEKARTPPPRTRRDGASVVNVVQRVSIRLFYSVPKLLKRVERERIWGEKRRGRHRRAAAASTYVSRKGT
jgi:hypothetical protein